MIRKTWRLLAACTALGLLGLGLSQPASADSGTQIADCSFSTLKADLEGGGDYFYAPGQCPSPIVFTDTITLTSSASLTEYGDDVTLDGGGQVQLFSVNSWTASLDLTGLTLSSGSAPGGTWGGGAITNFGTVRVTDSTFTDNNDGNTPAYGGGAILNAPGASLTITDSTFASNYDASWRGVGGGAIYNFAGTVDITNSTFADNWAGGPGSAIHNESGAVTVSNSTVTGSLLGYAALYGDSGSTFTIGGSIVAGNSPANCSANVIDNGYNLEDDAGASCGFTAANHDIVGGDPQLDPNGLQDNGGPTRTVALRPGSPARDAIPPSTGLCPTGDQRGQIRPGNGGDACDIGAYEFQEAPTRTTLSSSVNPSTVGQQVTFTATVSPAPDGGTVAFQDGGSTISGCGSQPVDPAGRATCQVTYAQTGFHLVSAVYSGDASYAGNTSYDLHLGIGMASTTTALTSSANPSTVGHQVTYTATVAPAHGGTVAFQDGGSTISGCGSQPLDPSGRATCQVTYAGTGTHTIAAVYTGDYSGYLGSTSSTLTQTVDKSSTATTLTSSANPAMAGRQVSFTASISPAPDGGTVTFTEGGHTINGCGAVAVSTASGTAGCNVSYPTAGTHTVTAAYSGDASHAGSASSGLMQTITSDLTTTVKVSPNPVARGGKLSIAYSVRNAGAVNESVALTYSLTDAHGAVTTYSLGTVAIKAGNARSGTVAYKVPRTAATGTWTVTFTASGPTGSSTATAPVTVK